MSADGSMLRQPPAAVEAEQAVLGGILVDARSLATAASIIGPEDFYRRDHAAIFRAVLELDAKGAPFDAVTLCDWADANNACVESAYLIDLAANAYTAANVKAHAEIIRDKAMLRRLIEAGTDLVGAGFQPDGRKAPEIIAETAARLSGLVPATTEATRSPKESMRSWFMALQSRMEVGSSMLGLPTPWKEINSRTRGLRPGRVYVIAGRSGMGKSILAAQLASFAALRKTRTLLNSLEMVEEEVRDRNVSAVADVPHDWIDCPSEDSPHWSAVNMAVRDLTEAPLLIDDTPGLTASQVCYRANSQHMREGLGLLIVDHLHELKLTAKSAQDRIDEYGESMRQFKELAKRLQIPVVVLAQLNRASGTERPTMSHLRASGRIEEVADVVLLIHRPEHYEPETHLKGVVELIVGKGRNFRGGDSITLRNRYDVMRADDWEGPLPSAPVRQEQPRTQRTTWGNRGAKND